MKLERDLNFEIGNSAELNKTLAGLLMDVRRGEVDHDTVKSITLIADKLNKNNVNAIDYKKLTKHGNKLSFFEGEDKTT